MGVLTKLRKATISSITSTRPSVNLSVRAGLPLDGLSRNLLFEDFSKMCLNNLSVIKCANSDGYFT